MAIKFINCDSCHKQTDIWDEFYFRGHVEFENNNESFPKIKYSISHWKGDICFDCQCKMRECLGQETLRGKA